MALTTTHSPSGAEGFARSIQDYIKLASVKDGAAVSIHRRGDGVTVIGTRGRFQQLIVTILGKLGLSSKNREVFEHFQNTLGHTYGHELAKTALQKAGIGGRGSSLTTPGVRKALEFAVSLRRTAATEKTGEYLTLITNRDDKIQKMTGLNPQKLSHPAIAYFRHHFKRALAAFRGSASNDPKEVDKLAADFLVHAHRMAKAGLAGIALDHAEGAEQAADGLVMAAAKSDATGVLKQAIELKYHLDSARRIESEVNIAHSRGPRGKGMLKEYVDSLSSPDRVLTGAVRAYNRQTMEDTQRHTEFLLKAINIASPTDSSSEIVGLADAKVMLEALMNPLERLGVKASPLSLDMKTERGLSNYAVLLDAVASFGGRPERVTHYKEFSRAVGSRLDEFARASNNFGKVPFSMSPLFSRLLKPKNEQEVIHSLNILKKYFDLQIVSAGKSLAEPANVLAQIGAEKMRLAEEERDWEGAWEDKPSAKFVAGKSEEIKQAMQKWNEAIKPLEVVRRKFVNLMQMMEGSNSILAQAGGSSLRQMMSVYPWQDADSAVGAKIRDTYGVLAMPTEFKMVTDRNAPLGVTWRVNSSALKAEYLQFRINELGEIVEEFLSGDLTEIKDEKNGPFKVPKQFMLDVHRQTTYLVTGDLPIPVEGPGKSGQERSVEVAKQIRKYVGNDKDLLQITSLMNQSIAASRLDVSRKGFMLPTLIDSDLAKGTVTFGSNSLTQKEGMSFTLNKIDKDNYLVAWESDLDLHSITATTGIAEGNGTLQFDYNQSLRGVTGREEILLTRKEDRKLGISLPVERIEMISPPPLTLDI